MYVSQGSGLKVNISSEKQDMNFRKLYTQLVMAECAEDIRIQMKNLFYSLPLAASHSLDPTGAALLHIYSES